MGGISPGVGSGNGNPITATQQAGLAQNNGMNNFQPNHIVQGQAQAPQPQGGGAMGYQSTNPMYNHLQDQHGLGPGFDFSSILPNSAGGGSNFFSGLQNFMNQYQQGQRNLINQQYYDPLGVQQQNMSTLANMGLGESPAGASLKNLADTRYFTNANQQMLNAQMGFLNGAGMGLLMPYAQADAQKGLQNFYWDNTGKIADQQRTLGDVDRKLQEAMLGNLGHLNQQLNPNYAGMSNGNISTGQVSMGGSPPGNPGMQQLTDMLQNTWGNNGNDVNPWSYMNGSYGSGNASSGMINPDGTINYNQNVGPYTGNSIYGNPPPVPVDAYGQPMMPGGISDFTPGGMTQSILGTGY